MKYSTRTILEYSFAAQRVNGTYVKHSQSNNGIYSNRDLIFRTIKIDHLPPDPNFVPLVVTDSEREKLAEADKYMRRYTMLSLGGLSQFQNDVYTAYLAEETEESRLGLIAYFPQFVEREIAEKVFKQTLKTEYKDSQHLTGDRFSGSVKILKVIPLLDYGKYLHIAGYSGNLVSFAVPSPHTVDTTVSIRARVRSRDSERSSGHPITALNYVKILEEN